MYVDPGDRAMRIVRAAKELQKDKSGEFTIMELAEACGRLPGAGFGRDLAHARHLALDLGDELTACYWSPKRKCQVLSYLTKDTEQGRSVWGIIRQGNDFKTRARNLKRHAGWSANNAETVEDRKLAKIAQKFAAGSENNAEGWTLLVEVIRDRRKDAS